MNVITTNNETNLADQRVGEIRVQKEKTDVIVVDNNIQLEPDSMEDDGFQAMMQGGRSEANVFQDRINTTYTSQNNPGRQIDI